MKSISCTFAKLTAAYCQKRCECNSMVDLGPQNKYLLYTLHLPHYRKVTIHLLFTKDVFKGYGRCFFSDKSKEKIKHTKHKSLS